MGEFESGKSGKKGGCKATASDRSPNGAADTKPEVIGAFMPTQANLDAVRKRGLLETGLAPADSADAECPTMTSAVGVATRTDGSQRNRRFSRGLHGGFEIPADEGTPILTLADGAVVQVHEGAAIGGLGAVLQHAPEDTGLGV